MSEGRDVEAERLVREGIAAGDPTAPRELASLLHTDPDRHWHFGVTSDGSTVAEAPASGRAAIGWDGDRDGSER